MSTDEFESLIEGVEETQTLEYKGQCAWSVRVFVKDILALSNVQDGGFIIVGFEDGTLDRDGLSDAMLDTYNIETMRDQLANYADPFVNFIVYKPIGRDGKNYVVIRVFEFPEAPVICRRDGHDINEGVVYYRARRKRPASEPINNSYDMRDVLDRAVVKLANKRKSQGYKVDMTIDNNEYYEEELGGL